MSVIQINRRNLDVKTFALFNLGFRPFFLGAAVFVIISIVLWMAVYFSQVSLPMGSLSSLQWHSHEMIYGYSVAVIAGFLLTAIMNWTGVQTLQGTPLAALFSLWCVARVSFLFGSSFLELAAIADLGFMIGLSAAVAAPIVKARQWKQLGILSKVLLLMLGNISFYLGAFGYLENGASWGIYGGLYTVIALILTIGSRVIPAFIRNGVPYQITIKNPIWISIATLFLFVLFFINQLFIQNLMLLGCLSIALFLINSYRLRLWYTPGIWSRPLLWSLYLSIAFITIGFLLFALTAFAGVSSFLAIHAFAYGGIGIATMGMMARVALGHTGRNIRTPSKTTAYALLVLTVGAVIRILFPLFYIQQYGRWIFLSQLAWIVAFALFLIAYSRILTQPDLNQKDG